MTPGKSSTSACTPPATYLYMALELSIRVLLWILGAHIAAVNGTLGRRVLSSRPCAGVTCGRGPGGAGAVHFKEAIDEDTLRSGLGRSGARSGRARRGQRPAAARDRRA